MDFVIVEPERVQVDNPFVVGFLALGVGESRPDMDAYYLGSLVGDPYNDDEFKLRLQRVRGRLNVKNMVFTNSFSRIDVKKHRQMSDDEKYQRKITRVNNEYQRQRTKIIGANLFATEELGALEVKYKRTLNAIKKQYNQSI